MEEAELTEMLKQEGSYTIFAPTDEAFKEMSEDDMKLLTSKPISISYNYVEKVVVTITGKLDFFNLND